MTGTEADRRVCVLVDLLALRVPVEQAVAGARSLPWDSAGEVAVLDRAAAVSALLRYRSGELTADQLEAWANAIEGREDIGFEPGHEQTLSQFVFQTANPRLGEALTDQYATSWIERLTSL